MFYTSSFIAKNSKLDRAYFDDSESSIYLVFKDGGTFGYQDVELQDFDNICNSFDVDNAVAYFNMGHTGISLGKTSPGDFVFRDDIVFREDQMIKYTDSHSPTNSSAVEDVFYDSDSSSMWVIFTGGPTYRYDDVPYNEFSKISEAESVGAAVSLFKKRFLTPGVYLGYLDVDDFEQKENGNPGLQKGNLYLVSSNEKPKPSFNVFVNETPKEVTKTDTVKPHEVEFKTDVTGNKVFTYLVTARGIDDAISQLTVVSDALSSVLTILSVKVIYERN